MGLPPPATPARTRAMKCRFAKLVLFVLGGAIINVAVAWGCHRSMNLETAPQTVYDEPLGNMFCAVVRGDMIGACVVNIMIVDWNGCHFIVPQDVDYEWVDRLEDVVPSWAGVVNERSQSVLLIGLGLPMKSFCVRTPGDDSSELR